MYRKVILFFVAGLSLLGFVDASYLSYARFTHQALVCNVLDGCNIVATSPHSVLFGIIPLAYLGLLFYCSIFILSVLLFFIKSKLLTIVLLVTSLCGMLSSAYFIYIQIYTIKALCIYCIVSACISFLLFLLILYFVYDTNVLPNTLKDKSGNIDE